MVTIAIDPGDKYTGWAVQGVGGQVTAGTHDSTESVEWLEQQLQRAHAASLEVEVVMEDYVLYPGQDQRRVFKRNDTSELIGMLKLTCMHHQVPYTMQGATIKKPTRRQLRARGITYAQGSDVHSRDAQLHLWHRVIRRRSGQVA